MFEILLISTFIICLVVKKGNKLETGADMILLIMVIIPIFILLLTAPFCSGWNEATADGHCTISVLTGLYNFVYGMVFILAFLGGPFIILIALLISVTFKIIRFKKSRHKHRGTVKVNPIVKTNFFNS